MHAAVVNVMGEAPRYESFAEPVAGVGEAAITVRAAGLHPIVKGIRLSNALCCSAMFCVALEL
jgi:hypothetical protein